MTFFGGLSLGYETLLVVVTVFVAAIVLAPPLIAYLTLLARFLQRQWERVW